VASGYNLFRRALAIPAAADVAMVAPRMIGASVRTRLRARRRLPVLCVGGAGRDGAGVGAGAVESSAREETLIDLFAEQALWPRVIAAFTEAYVVLHGLGCSDEALVHELWLSKEPAEVFKTCADDGFIRQLVHHSSVRCVLPMWLCVGVALILRLTIVGQYGQLKGSFEINTSEI